MTTTPERFAALLRAEQQHQADRFAGGSLDKLAEEDDSRNTLSDWAAYLGKYATAWLPGSLPPWGEYTKLRARTHMVKVATLAFSAHASLTRVLDIRTMEWGGDLAYLRAETTRRAALDSGFNTFRQGTKWSSLEDGNLVDLVHVETGALIGTYRVSGPPAIGQLDHLITDHGDDNIVQVASGDVREDLERVYGPVSGDQTYTVVHFRNL